MNHNNSRQPRISARSNQSSQQDIHVPKSTVVPINQVFKPRAQYKQASNTHLSQKANVSTQNLDKSDDDDSEFDKIEDEDLEEIEAQQPHQLPVNQEISMFQVEGSQWPSYPNKKHATKDKEPKVSNLRQQLQSRIKTYGGQTQQNQQIIQKKKQIGASQPNTARGPQSGTSEYYVQGNQKNNQTLAKNDSTNQFYSQSQLSEVGERLYKQHKIKKSTEQCQLQKEIKEAQEFSFKPQLIAKKRKQQVYDQSRSPIKTSQNLFELAKQKKQRRERMHSAREEKQIRECTFSPKINYKKTTQKLVTQKNLVHKAIHPIIDKRAGRTLPTTILLEEMTFMPRDAKLMKTISSPVITRTPSAVHRRNKTPNRFNQAFSPTPLQRYERCLSGDRSTSKLTSNTGYDNQKHDVYGEMVQREFDDILAEIVLEKQSKGIIYDDFEALMLKHGFTTQKLIPFLQKVFIVASGFNIEQLLVHKSIITGKQQTKFTKKVPLMRMDDLMALIFSIRNRYDTSALQDKIVNIGPITKNQTTRLLTLLNEQDFKIYHQLLQPLNQVKTEFVFKKKKALKDKRQRSLISSPLEQLQRESITPNKLRLPNHKLAQMGPELMVPPIDDMKQVMVSTQSLLVNEKPMIAEMRPSVSLKNKILYRLTNLKTQKQSESPPPQPESFKLPTTGTKISEAFRQSKLTPLQNLRMMPMFNSELQLSAAPSSNVECNPAKINTLSKTRETVALRSDQTNQLPQINLDLNKIVNGQDCLHQIVKQKSDSSLNSRLNDSQSDEFKEQSHDNLHGVMETETNELPRQMVLPTQQRRPTVVLATLEAVQLQKIMSKSNQMVEDPKPIFYKEFNLGNETQPLIIYKHDSWQEVVQTFSKYNELDPVTTQSINNLVQQAMQALA